VVVNSSVSGSRRWWSVDVKRGELDHTVSYRWIDKVIYVVPINSKELPGAW